jgi:hypothetical protein
MKLHMLVLACVWVLRCYRQFYWPALYCILKFVVIFCMCVDVFMCVFVCRCIYIMCVRVCMYVCMYVYKCIYMHVCMYVNVFICMYLNIYMHVCNGERSQAGMKLLIQGPSGCGKVSNVTLNKTTTTT